MESLPEPGVYQHQKGGTYTLLFVATESTNVREGVLTCVYVSHTYGSVRVRELTEWNERVLWPDGVVRSRFTLKDELEAGHV